MSDRDKKIILFLAIIMVTVLPYVFYIKDTRINTQTTLVNVEALEERYKQLQSMNENRQFYLDETDRMHDERDKIVASFPADIRTDNYIMFLLQAEYSSDMIPVEETEYYTYSIQYQTQAQGQAVAAEGEEEEVVELSGELAHEFPIRFDQASFSTNVETPISTAEMDTGYAAIANASELSYVCYYGGMKYLLGYIMDYKDPMIYREISMEMNPATGVVTGEMLMAQYAIAGPGRELEDVDFTIMQGGIPFDLSLDALDLRGNEDVGIFGEVRIGVEEDNEIVEPEEEAVE